MELSNGVPFALPSNYNNLNFSTTVLAGIIESLQTTADFEETLQEELGYTDTSTYPAAPVTVIDLKEPLSLESEFFYNYYTKDERSATPGIYTTVNIHASDQDVEFLS